MEQHGIKDDTSWDMSLWMAARHSWVILGSLVPQPMRNGWTTSELFSFSADGKSTQQRLFISTWVVSHRYFSITCSYLPGCLCFSQRWFWSWRCQTLRPKDGQQTHVRFFTAKYGEKTDVALKLWITRNTHSSTLWPITEKWPKQYKYTAKNNTLQYNK